MYLEPERHPDENKTEEEIDEEFLQTRMEEFGLSEGWDSDSEEDETQLEASNNLISLACELTCECHQSKPQEVGQIIIHKSEDQETKTATKAECTKFKIKDLKNPHVIINMGDNKGRLILLDTGAMLNILSLKNVLQIIKSTWFIEGGGKLDLRRYVHAVGANSQDIPIVGKLTINSCWLTSSVDEPEPEMETQIPEKLNMEFWISPSCKDNQIILGAPQLKQLSATIDFEESCLYIKNTNETIKAGGECGEKIRKEEEKWNGLNQESKAEIQSYITKAKLWAQKQSITDDITITGNSPFSIEIEIEEDTTKKDSEQINRIQTNNWAGLIVFKTEPINKHLTKIEGLNLSPKTIRINRKCSTQVIELRRVELEQRYEEDKSENERGELKRLSDRYEQSFKKLEDFPSLDIQEDNIITIPTRPSLERSLDKFNPFSDKTKKIHLIILVLIRNYAIAGILYERNIQELKTLIKKDETSQHLIKSLKEMEDNYDILQLYQIFPIMVIIRTQMILETYYKQIKRNDETLLTKAANI